MRRVGALTLGLASAIGLLSPSSGQAAWVTMGRRLVLVCSLAAAVLGLAPLYAQAATFRVTRYDDGPAASCTSKNCTLRDAVTSADAVHGHNTILLPPGVYALELTNGKDAAALDILGNTVTIKGVGGQAIIDAGGSRTESNALYVFSGGHAILQDVSVRDAIGPPDADNVDRGGAIRVDNGGSLVMSDGSVTSSSVPDVGSLGGGIYNNGTVTLTRVRIENNTTGEGYGAGVYTDVNGVTTITDSEITENHASFGGGLDGTGTFKVRDTLIRDNTADDGGGARLEGCNPDTFSYDTFSGNGAGTHGGALEVEGPSVFLFHDTVADNVAGQAGGGLATAQSTCPSGAFLRDTIMAGNATGTGTGQDCADYTQFFGQLTTGDNISYGHNIIGDESDCGINQTTGDKFGVNGNPFDPRLAPLENNGGPTFTMALLPGSPAIGAADPRFCGKTDQRGFAIADDGDHGCDIGAYEFFFPPHSVTAPKISGSRTLNSSLTCSTGEWSGATLSFAFQWLRDRKPILGATSAHHTVTSADQGHSLRCRVTATNVAGRASATSPAFKIPK